MTLLHVVVQAFNRSEVSSGRTSYCAVQAVECRPNYTYAPMLHKSTACCTKWQHGKEREHRLQGHLAEHISPTVAEQFQHYDLTEPLHVV